MNRILRRPAPLAVAAVLALAAACGGSAGTSPSASVPTATSTAGASDANPSDALGSSLPSFAIPSSNDAPDLAATLPDQLGGDTLQKVSYDGNDLGAAGDEGQSLSDLLGQLGKSPDDVSFAVGYSLATDATVSAFRVKGVDSGQMLQLYESSVKDDTPDATFTSATVGGKQVVKEASASDGSSDYVYVKGDTLYFVEADDDSLVSEAFSKLP